MKQNLVPNIYNSKRTRKLALKKNRKPIKDSTAAKARKKLFKVKHADNDILFNNPEDPNRNIGGHYVLTIAINPQNNNVGVSVITSLEDRFGNPAKQDQVEKSLILPLPHTEAQGIRRKSGIKQDVLTENTSTGRKINFNDLKELRINNQILLPDEKEVSEFLFNNVNHYKKSKRNKTRTVGYIKIK